MMAPVTAVKKAKEVKEKVAHPQSRKAGQLERKQLRKTKLAGATSKKHQLHTSIVDKFNFWYNVIPIDKDCLTLPELHDIVRDVWLTRHDEELEAERATRRKGRPKSVKEMKLEDIKQVENEAYRAGIEIPDLTHPPTVEMFRKWDLVDLPFLQLLRFIRISSEHLESAPVTRSGKHQFINDSMIKDSSSGDTQDHKEKADMLFGTAVSIPLQYSSTMMTMDVS